MKILLVNSSDVDGGAARAAYRLHQGLQQVNGRSQMLVKTKLGNDEDVISMENSDDNIISKLRLKEKLDNLPLKFYRQRDQAIFSLQWMPDKIAAKVAEIKPDIVNLHWICHSYLQIETLAKLRQPLVWTFHDMWGFTGGCHYSGDCQRYQENCGNCPTLNSRNDRDLSRWVWERKKQAWQNLNLTIITPSRWLGNLVKTSSLLQNYRVEVIANGIDLNIYQPIDRYWAREQLKLPQDKKLVLFGAMNSTSDRRKGFHLLKPTLQSLSQSAWKQQIELVIFGGNPTENQDELGFKCHYLGQFKDDSSLALAYSAADVFIAPSLEDNLPNTIMESIACGTPCVGFNIGGLPDMIEHEKNGYLAKPYEIDDLAKGLIWVLENQERYQKLQHRARQKAEEEFALELQAKNYLQVFNNLVNY